MNYAEARSYCLSRPEAWEDQPFGADTLVIKVKDKLFAILFAGGHVTGGAGTAGINLKCDPDQAMALRDVFDAVTPGYHMNKKHWNTVKLDGSIPPGEIERMIDHSYALVVKSLGSKRKSLEIKYGADELYRA